MSLTKSPWSRRTASTLTVFAMLATVGCSAATDSAPGQSSGEIKDGGTLVVAQAFDPDPASFLKTAIGNIVSEYAVFETLTLINPDTFEPEGVLAESWELNDDATSMSLTLRDDVTFHSGKKLTADDVMFVIEKAKDPAVGAANQVIASHITGMESTSDYELTLNFDQPLPNIFDLFETMPILNKDAWDDYAAGKEVDGTGRFEWDSYTPGGQIVLTKYDDHRDAENTHLDEIQIDIIGDSTALVSAVRSGSAQYAVGVAPVDARSLGEQPGFELVTTGGAAFPLALDVTEAPFDDKVVRQAVHYAIDRERIVEQVEGGHGEPSSVPWRSTTIGYDESQAQHYTYDPEKAEDMLAEAGVEEGISFDIVMGDNPETQGIFQILKNNLEAVGLNATPVILSAAEYEEKLATRSFDAPMVLMQASNGLSPASAVATRPELTPANNVSKFESTEYDDLVNAVTTASTTDAQEQALEAYNEYFIDEAFAVPLITRPTITVRSETLIDLRATQMGFLYIAEAGLSD